MKYSILIIVALVSFLACKINISEMGKSKDNVYFTHKTDSISGYFSSVIDGELLVGHYMIGESVRLDADKALLFYHTYSILRREHKDSITIVLDSSLRDDERGFLLISNSTIGRGSEKKTTLNYEIMDGMFSIDSNHAYESYVLSYQNIESTMNLDYGLVCNRLVIPQFYRLLRGSKVIISKSKLQSEPVDVSVLFAK